MLPYLALLRMGFSVPPDVTADAVGSYPTVSPLPVRVTPDLGGLLSVPLSVALGLATYSARSLTGILPCGARTFLPPHWVSPPQPAIAWPTFRGGLYGLAGLIPIYRRLYRLYLPCPCRFQTPMCPCAHGKHRHRCPCHRAAHRPSWRSSHRSGFRWQTCACPP